VHAEVFDERAEGGEVLIAEGYAVEDADEEKVATGRG